MVWELTTNLFLVLYFITIIGIILMLLMENRSPVKSIAWIFVLILLPVVGLLLYILVGKNFRKKMVISHRSLAKWKERIETIKGNPMLEKSFPKQYKNFAYMAVNSSNSTLYVNNGVRLFTTGKEFFDSMFAEVEKARKYVHVEFYIFNSDTIGSKFIEILKRKAKEGVKVRVIIDDVGSWLMRKSSVREMRAAGIEIYCFLKVGLPAINSKVNYRNHRKIVVIDGDVGYTGGMNVADRYVEGSKWGAWRDTHLRIEGEAVHGLQRVFLSDWYFVSRSLLSDDPLYYPTPDSPSGNSLVQVVSSSPDSEWESIMQTFFMAIAQARNYIYLQTPYFLPNQTIVNALQCAALGGVDVRIIIPRHSDASFALKSSMTYIDEMLNAGVKVYFFEEGFIHSKTIVIDDNLSTVGSANMDFRSFEQNFEINTWIYDPEFAQTMKNIFLADLEKSSQINLEEWRNRPRLEKFGESWARLFSPLM
ncbi:MAG: cardiolipin synthase [Paludibacteraceae bacterium]|nr:cardiolipin synthase [Paludibacteraceae bacterium]MBR6106244.1 cardiolipin synthase [Paludibacteraceae bacterium]